MEYGVWDIETTSLDPKEGAIREIYTRIGNSIFHGWICNSVTMIETVVPWTVPQDSAYPGQCPSESQLCYAWLLWLEQQPAANIWGYNSSKFDLPWMEEKLMQHKVISHNLPGIKHRWHDLYVLMQQVIPRGQSRKLLDVWKSIFPNRPEPNAHQASVDSEMLHDIVQHYGAHVGKMVTDPRRSRTFFWAGEEELKQWSVRQFMYTPRLQLERKTWYEWMKLYYQQAGDFDTERGLQTFCENNGFHGEWIFSMWKTVWRTFQLWNNFQISQKKRGVKRQWQQ